MPLKINYNQVRFAGHFFQFLEISTLSTLILTDLRQKLLNPHIMKDLLLTPTESLQAFPHYFNYSFMKSEVRWKVILVV